MQNSTPIGALSRNEEQDPNTREMVENIVNEIDDRGMGSMQLPPGDPRMQGSFDDRGMMEGMHGDPRMMGGMPQGMPPQPGDQQFGMEYGAPPDPSSGWYPAGPVQGGHPQQQHHQGPPPGMMVDNQSGGGYLALLTGGRGGLTGMAKDPLLVAGLFFILSNPMVARLVESYIPYTSGGGMMGMLARALLAGALFFVLKMFVVKN